MSSRSPQRSVSRFLPRQSYATSCLHSPPPALTQPARTQRLGRRRKRMRRRRLSKLEEDEEEEVMEDQ